LLLNGKALAGQKEDLMWPLKKKVPPLAELPRDGAWLVAQGSNEGKPLIARINTSVDEFRGHPELTYQVGVAIPLKLPDENGMPQAAEAEELNQIEDLVFDILEVQSRSVLVAVITTRGMREFVLYAVDPEEVKSNHTRLCQAVTTGHEVQLMIQTDPKWNVFAAFRDAG
jgi:hypothetical protein